jgi:hypothetical protein
VMAFASRVGGRTPAARKAANDDMRPFNIPPFRRQTGFPVHRARGVSAVLQCSTIKYGITTVGYLIQIKTGSRKPCGPTRAGVTLCAWRKTVSLYGNNAKAYVQTDAPGTIDELVDEDRWCDAGY